MDDWIQYTIHRDAHKSKYDMQQLQQQRSPVSPRGITLAQKGVSREREAAGHAAYEYAVAHSSPHTRETLHFLQGTSSSLENRSDIRPEAAPALLNHPHRKPTPTPTEEVEQLPKMEPEKEPDERDWRAGVPTTRPVREDAAVMIQSVARGWFCRKAASEMRRVTRRQQLRQDRDRGKLAQEHRAMMERLCAEEEARRQRRRRKREGHESRSMEDIRTRQQRLMQLRDRMFRRRGNQALIRLQQQMRDLIRSRRERKQAEQAMDTAHETVERAKKTAAIRRATILADANFAKELREQNLRAEDAARERAISDALSMDAALGISSEEDRQVAEKAASAMAAMFRGRAIRERLRRVRRIAWRAKLRVPNRERLQKLFRTIDVSGDGQLSAQEWLRASMKGGDGEVDSWEWYNPSDDEEEELDAVEDEEGDLEAIASEDEGADTFPTTQTPPMQRAVSTPVRAADVPVPSFGRSKSFLAGILGPKDKRRGTRLKISGEKHMRVFRAIDADESGEIDEDEFVDFFMSTKNEDMLNWMQGKLIQILEPEMWATQEHRQKAKDILQKRRIEAAERAVRIQHWRKCARKLFAAADIDNSGDITPLELRRVFANGPKDHPITTDPDRALTLFRLFDADRSGSVEESELIDAFGSEAILPDDLRSWLIHVYGAPN